MANEYLKRTPTSTGNRRVFTWSAWVKKTENSGGFGRFFESGTVGNRTYFTYTDLDKPRFTEQAVNSNRDILVSNYTLRDSSSICHVMIAVNSTLSNEDDRVKIYINGSSINNHGFSTDDPPALNALFQHNEAGEVQYIGNSANQAADFQGYMSDVFHVDGQALTPDVFGFYKDGDGYMSSGTAQATDFRPGQWVPKSPSVIKNVINDSGGFGVNGFYLPMNDSSNPGADFHCAPNSIITLKGEDLPQPRNGAPTTSDAYVSQLRSDPYAANLVLAVPGIGALRGTETVSNGNFSDGTTTGWTSNRSATITNNNGVMRVTNGASTTSGAHYPITTEIGKYYNLTFDVLTGANNAYIGVTDSNLYNSGTFVLAYAQYVNGSYSVVFKATSTTEILHFHVYGGSSGSFKEFDNISVREVNAPRDYSADIKGSGTNKTLTANGNAGVGYELGNYYGSGMSFPNASSTSGDDKLTVTDSDFAMGTGDFTIEVWINPDALYDYQTIFTTRPDNGSYTDGFNLWVNLQGATGVYSNAFLTQTANGTINANQWTHVVAERYNGTLTTYVNGVAAAVQTSNTQNYTRTAAAIGQLVSSNLEAFTGQMQDLRVYKGVAKYKGGFDVPKPYTPVGIEAFRTTADTCSNNFATLNSIDNNSGVLSNGNLTYDDDGSSGWNNSRATIGASSGKWYWEMRVDAINQVICASVAGPSGNDSTNGARLGFLPGQSDDAGVTYYDDGRLYHAGAQPSGQVSWGASYGATDIIGIALDMDDAGGKVWFAKNNSWQASGNPSTGANAARSDLKTYADTYFPTSGTYFANTTQTFNFGQNPSFSGQVTAGTNADDSGKGLFKYAPPTGFLALCEDNLPTPAIADPGDHFKTVLYEGDNTAGRRINVGFQPDFIWFKSRNAAVSHVLVDSVRGFGHLNSNGSNAESTSGTLYLSGYADNGFDLNDGANSGGNTTGRTYVAWCWKAGGAAVSNTDGTIASQVSVNQDAGFSIATWTSTGSNDALQTVGHGLDTAPNMIILKNRDAAVNWRVYHSGINDGSKNSVTLNSTEAAYVFWPSVGDDTFGLANSTTTGQAAGLSGQDIVAYCWTEIEGFSKFGSYVGNASADGPFVYCGFKPAFVMLKASSTTGNWCMIDNARNSVNPTNFFAVANAANNGDDTGGALDFLSNGFKLRLTSSNFNGNGTTYIFMAFAESPFQTANAK